MSGDTDTNQVSRLRGQHPRESGDSAARPGPKYDAFLSYGHAADATLAPVLQAELQRYAKPWYRARALSIFRDDTDLAAGPALWAAIERALEASSWFVLLASPAAARSPWVDREVAWWLEHRSPDRLLIALTDGDLADVLPPALRAADLPEPLWVDLREVPRDGLVDREDAALQDAVVDLAATMRTLSKAELVGEHNRQHRRTLRLAGGAIVALSVLLVAALVATVIAFVQRDQAIAQQRLAVSRLLVPQAEAVRSNDPRTALLLNEAAAHLNPDGGNTRASLLQTLVGNQYGGTLGGHSGAVPSVVYSPDGRSVATAGADRTVVVWDLGDPAAPRQGPTLTGFTAGIRTVAYSPDGHHLAAGSADGSAVLWDLSDLAAPRRGPTLTGHTAPVSSVAYSPDGRTVADAGSDGTTILWDLTDPTTPRRGATLTGRTPGVTAVAFTPDGHQLASGGADGSTVLWDVTDPTIPRPGPVLTSRGPSFPVTALAVSHTGRTLATTSGSDVLLWDLTGPAPHVLPGSSLSGGLINDATSVAFSPDGRTLAAGGVEGNVVLWDVTDRNSPGPPRTLTALTGGVLSVAFSPDSHTLATGTVGQGAVLWNLVDPSALRPGPVLRGLSGDVGTVAFSPDGHTAAAGSQGGTTALWDVSNPSAPRMEATLAGHANSVDAVAFSPDGKTLVTGSADHSAIVWDVNDPAAPRRGATLLSTNAFVNSVAFSPDGRTLATGMGNPRVPGSDDRPNEVTVLWDLTDPSAPRRAATLAGYDGAVHAVSFSADGRLLATGSDDTSVVVWDLSDPAAPRRLPTLTGLTDQVHSIAFSPAGRTLVVSSLADAATLWDLSDPAAPSRGATLSADRVVYSLAFSPDGRTLAVVGGTPTLWDLSDPSSPRPGPPWRTPDLIQSVAFSSDGRLATGTTDGTVDLWDPTGFVALRDHALQSACGITHGGMTPDEWAKYVPGLAYEDACASG